MSLIQSSDICSKNEANKKECVCETIRGINLAGAAHELSLIQTSA